MMRVCTSIQARCRRFAHRTHAPRFTNRCTGRRFSRGLSHGASYGACAHGAWHMDGSFCNCAISNKGVSVSCTISCGHLAGWQDAGPLRSKMACQPLTLSPLQMIICDQISSGRRRSIWRFRHHLCCVFMRWQWCEQAAQADQISFGLRRSI